MKKLFVAGLCVLTLAANAQKPTTSKTATSKTPVKTAAQPKPLKNNVDSVSYAIGYMVASFYKQQGIEKMNAAALSKAITDVYGNKPALMTENEANVTLMKCMNPDLSKNIEEGEKFLSAVKKKQGVSTTPSGIAYEVLALGNGVKPGPTDSVTVNYKGNLISGFEFDKNNGITFRLDQVIPGWTESLQLMAVGSKYKIYIPYQLAYGLNGQGPIPGGSMLIFEVELLDVKGK